MAICGSPPRAKARPLVDDFGALIGKTGFAELPMTCAHAIRAGNCEVKHRDPFDRMLAAQSSVEDLRLVTRDPVFTEFGLEPIW